MITLTKLINAAEDIKSDDSWVNDSHSSSEYHGLKQGLDRIVNHFKEVDIIDNNYQLYLFSQLFHISFKDTSLNEIPYDLLFPNIEEELKLFLKSTYNVVFKSEYDCMKCYLEENNLRISNKLKQISN